jgi:predicted PurR-regulated permease PerM
MAEAPDPDPIEPLGPTDAPDGPASSADRVVVEVGWIGIWRVIGAILLTLLLLRFSAAASTLLGMVAISFFFSLALEPAVRNLRRRYGWRRGAAVGVIYAAGFGFVVFLVLVLIPAVGQLADSVSANVDDWLLQLRTWTEATFGVAIPTLDVAADAPGAGDALGGFVDEPLGTLLGFASTGIGLVFNLATIAMFTFYFSAEAPGVQRAVLRLFPPKAQERIGWTWDQAIVQTGGYFYSRMLLMLINGFGFFITMALLGVPMGLALGMAVFGGFVSVFIPAVGTYIGGAVPILVTLALRGLVPGLVVLGYVLVYQQIENYWLSPKISADTMTLNGGVAFGAALAGGAIAGPMGAFVALPVAALITSSISNYARSYEVVYDSSLGDVEAGPTDGHEQGRLRAALHLRRGDQAR